MAVGDFAAVGEVTGVGEGGDDAAVGSAGRVPSAMVEVEVGIDDDVDFFGSDAARRRRRGELLFGGIDCAEFVTEFVTYSVSMATVCWPVRTMTVLRPSRMRFRRRLRPFFPERLGDDAEHGSAVEEVVAVGEEINSKLPTVVRRRMGSAELTFSRMWHVRDRLQLRDEGSVGDYCSVS